MGKSYAKVGFRFYFQGVNPNCPKSCSFFATCQTNLVPNTVYEIVEIKNRTLQCPKGFHKEAMGAAEASIAAGAQGKFWEMHDKLFANQKQLGIDNIKIYAQELGLDMGKFNADMDSHKYKKEVDGDMKLARGAGVRGTPTFFINGKKLVGAKPLNDFKKVIDAIDKQ